MSIARSIRGLVLALTVSVLGACAAIGPEFQVEAYSNATSLKAESLALMAKSGEPYAVYAEKVDALKVKVDAAYEFSAGLPRNEESAKQWQTLRAPEKRLLFPYLDRWAARGPQPQDYRLNKIRQIGQAFDELICLEINKKETVSCDLPDIEVAE